MSWESHINWWLKLSSIRKVRYCLHLAWRGVERKENAHQSLRSKEKLNIKLIWIIRCVYSNVQMPIFYFLILLINLSKKFKSPSYYSYILSVMSVKIKSILAHQAEPSQLNPTSAISPSRCEMSRLSSGSALKNLSHERYMKKLSKLKDSSDNYRTKWVILRIEQ